jgi:hypothetical protein
MSPADSSHEQNADQSAAALHEIASLNRQIASNNSLIQVYEREIQQAVERGWQEHPTQIQSCQNTIRALESENDRLEGYIDEAIKKVGR